MVKKQNRALGIKQGFSGNHEKDKGTIRVGALDCSVEPDDEKQGSPKYSIRKVAYSANGSMIDIYHINYSSHFRDIHHILEIFIIF